MSKDGKRSFLGHFKTGPAAVVIQEPGAPKPAATQDKSLAKTKKKDGGRSLSSLFGLKSKSKGKDPAATGGSTSAEAPAGKHEVNEVGANPDLDPWSRAYAELKKHDSTKALVETCEKILTYRANKEGDKVVADIPLNAPNQFSTLSEAESVDKLSVILQPVLNSYQEETWWDTTLEGADMVISKIGKGVGDALQACQPAAFAWSAICLAVPVCSIHTW